MVISKRVITRELLPKAAKLKVFRLVISERGWDVEASGDRSAKCPTCATKSRSRHSRYGRKLQDLPVQGSPVRLHLQVGRWRCGNDGCPRKIFTERAPELALPWARRTNRLREVVRLIGHGMGGRPGERLLSRLGMPVSDDTIMRAIKRVDVGTGAVPLRVVGVDDWAWKKGQTCGTILVDLERRGVVDILPDRSAESLSAWLAQHPEIEFLSRDRQGLYAEGARHGAPQAQQVADRFHLSLNLSTAVEQELARHRSFLSLPRPISTSTASLEGGASASEVVRNRQRIVDERHVAKQALFETVHALHASGKTVSGIVRETGISRQRVSAWVGLVELPERNRMAPNPRTPAFYEEHLAQRWAEGFQHGRKLLKEIQALGYTGCFSYLARFLAGWRQKTSSTPLTSATTMPTAKVAPPAESNSSLLIRRQISPLVATALLGKLRSQMTAEQGNTVDALKKACPGYAVMRSLVLSFRTILRTGKIKTLHAWMKKADASGLYRMQRFVRRLKQDQSAVEAAVEQSWSNGPVEGHINRLKTLKRQMYGRAGFELLRARVLPLPPPAILHQE
jgi:transposase